MARRENLTEVEVRQLLAPATRTASANSASCDLKGVEAATFAVSYGAAGDTLSASVKIEAKLQESDDGSTWADVSGSDLVGTTTNQFALADANADANAVYVVGYRGTKRYVRVVVTYTGTHTNGTPCAAYAILSKQSKAPVSYTVTP